MSTAVATLTRATSPRRSTVLLVLFAGVAWLLASMSAPIESAPPRWPADGSSLYQVDGWTVSPAQLDSSRPGLAMVTHTYLNANGTRATFVISSSPMAKAVYRAGAAVPFLGNGYTVEPAPGEHETQEAVALREHVRPRRIVERRRVRMAVDEFAPGWIVE